MKKKILVISAGRSDYGRLYPIIDNLQKTKKVKLFLYLTRAHDNKVLGYTANDIKKKFKVIKKKITFSNFNDSPFQMIQNLCLDLNFLSNHVRKIKPDVIIISGDRYEMLIGPLVAIPNNIPTFHFFGGAITEGAIDELIRHSITKMSHYHFVLLNEYKRRLYQLGEETWRVKSIGMPSLINMKLFKTENIMKMSRCLKFDLRRPFMIVTYHPVTLELQSIKFQINSLVRAIKKSNLNAIVTYPNADPKFGEIIKILKSKLKDKNKFLLVKNLGDKNYFGLMKYAKLILGNSSSGIVEAPSFNLPVVNVGSRQDGKFKPKNIINTGYSYKEILKGIKKALNNNFRKKLSKLKNPYEPKTNIKKIINMILNIKIEDKLLRKKFINKMVKF